MSHKNTGLGDIGAAALVSAGYSGQPFREETKMLEAIGTGRVFLRDVPVDLCPEGLEPGKSPVDAMPSPENSRACGGVKGARVAGVGRVGGMLSWRAHPMESRRHVEPRREMQLEDARSHWS